MAGVSSRLVRSCRIPALMALVSGASGPALGATPRARDLGIPFERSTPGPLNAITDVAGVAVGHVTLVDGDDIRTGVTAVVPRVFDDKPPAQCFGASFRLNGNGEMTGLPWVDESGLVEGPILLTNTNSVGVVRDAVIKYAARKFGPTGVWSLPIVAETWDGTLNDIYGHHVRESHAFEAIEGARGGAVAEGAVGGGTGMICFEFKGGIGTASRLVQAGGRRYVVGALVQANFGRRPQLRIAGLPVGLEIKEDAIYEKEGGSIIIVIATDAPLLPHQLARLARRGALGIARTGGIAGNSSGDIVLAFSTANPRAGDSAAGVVALEMLPAAEMDEIFEAVAGATEESIINALVAGRTMVGYEKNRVIGLPHDRVRTILRRHGRLVE